jgi:hypothetical protein
MALFAILYLSYANYRRLKARLGLLPQMLVVSVATAMLFTSPFHFEYFKEQDRALSNLAEDTGLSVTDAMALKRLDPRLIPRFAAMLDNPAQAPKAIDNLYCYLGHTPEVMPAFVQALTNALPEVRIRAIYALTAGHSMLSDQPALVTEAKALL